MIFRTRSMTVLGGFGLAGAVLTLLALAGVGGDRSPAPDGGPGDVTGPDPAMAIQPQLREAMLDAADLAQEHASTAAPAPDRQPPPSSLPVPVVACRDLFERLEPPAGSAARETTTTEGTTTEGTTTEGTTTEGTTRRRGAPRVRWRQAVSVYPETAAREGDRAAAEEAYATVRRAGDRCRRFAAALEDGRPVTVEVVDASTTESARRGSGREGFTARLSVTGRGTRLGGYLAVGRVGRVLTVLRRLGPAGSVRGGEMAAVLRRALDKLTPVTRLLHGRRADRPAG
jgi:hypothetical protein